ncbi:MAG: hypothetical protein A2Z47_02480 [Thermodesulfovibrio sp. RBG_19FT_COMBO_42_12]|nr:MAG: hypothetical protein A2Z47_02480 [Thermodesulfovibrio sp. RBG_19FT_COMBO_42_12]
MKINIDYIARVEGEGSVKFEIKGGKLKELKLNIWEPPRFFEGFLVGRKYDEVPDIVSRICGICPVSHMTTSIYAIEKAIGFTPSLEIKKIRRIMSLSQIAASHLVHLYMLALPDYYKTELLFSGRSNPPPSPFSKGGKEGLLNEINRLLRLKEAVNNVTALFGGRPLHPVAMVVGGFTKVPSRDEIGRMIKQLEDIKEDALETVKMISGLNYPDFKNSTEYVAIFNKNDYAINEGTITSSSGLRAEIDDYHSYFEEEEVSYSNAKRTVLKGKEPIMVGALSRLNIKFDMLHPEAKKAAEKIGFKILQKNPYLNNVAQAIEIVHGIWECIELLDSLSIKDFFIKVNVKEGSGSAATEAPRGMLYHQYELNGRGIIERANIVTPTAYNFLSLEESLKKLVNENIDKPVEELSLLCEMLVRAYDPCFSCSVH